MPAWVDKCVREYLKKGLAKDEAWKRCMGAYNKKKKSRKRKSK